jgi:hypothetical protein
MAAGARRPHIGRRGAPQIPVRKPQPLSPRAALVLRPTNGCLRHRLALPLLVLSARAWPTDALQRRARLLRFKSALGEAVSFATTPRLRRISSCCTPSRAA